jgi:spermidine synthase
LYNGAILHGAQFTDPRRSRIPTTYYGTATGGGIALAYRAGTPRKLGVIGLGAGTLAVYGRPGDVIRFYEINPLVIDIANRNFRYLRESQARVEVVAGDARLSLEREPAQGFDVLALDAFSGDSIPVHLLTREAFALYLRHLQPRGILAVHVSNGYLDLAPVVARVAESFGKRTCVVVTPATRNTQKSDWVLMSDDADFMKIAQGAANHTPVRRIEQPWTDDYSNLFRIIK